MKKVAVFLSVLFTLISSILLPFSVYASVSGFDYSNYYELDYIESSGSQYIDSGIPVTGGHIHDINFEFTSKSAKSYIFGGGYNYLWDRLYIKTSGNIEYEVRNKQITWSSDFLNTNVSFTGSSINPNEYGSVNNSSLTFASTNGNAFLSQNIYIFACNANGTVSGRSSAKLYYYKIYNSSNQLAAYFVPAMRKQDNAVGVYDTINSTFIGNSGTGTFSYGAIIPSRYTITTSVSPTGAGSVTGGGEYDAGTIVTLTATPNTGYSFVRWSDNSYTNPRTVIANSSQSYTAIFQEQSTPVTRYTISTSLSPSGAGSVTGGGEYDAGTTITLTAVANNGYIFTQWSDGVTNASRSVTVDSNMSFTAEFSSYTPPAQTYTINTSVSPSGAGSVTGGGTYELNDAATLTAVPSSGYVFASWSDGFTQNPRQIQVTSNMNLTAYFTNDLSSDIVIGTNLNLIDYDQNRFITTISGTNNNNRIDLSLSPLNVYENILYEFEGILNDDYIGSVVMTISYETSSGSSTSFNRTVFVNGNNFKYSTFIYERIVNFSVSYNTNGLYKKQSVTSGIFDGTTESTQSEQILDQSNEDLTDTVNQFDNLESGFNDDMNDALENIDVSVNPGSFGSKFQSSAIWVSQQFNTLTSNTPYGSILGFSLVLGVSLLIIGKVLG